MRDVKRLNYFNHQFLIETDFRDEQDYHIEMRRRHNRFMHGWGIAEGLRVERNGERELTISPGMALDSEGREIVLVHPTTLVVEAPHGTGHVYAVLNYDEEKAGEQNSRGVTGFTRTKELAVASIVQHHPEPDGNVIALARIHLDDAGRISSIDYSVRHEAGFRLEPGVIRTELLADHSVTRVKLAEEVTVHTGWTRSVFKPVALSDKPQFRIGPTEARADDRGAEGTMSIPSPPGANRVTGFRITGEWNDGEIRFALFRAGWIPDLQQHERHLLLEDTLKRKLPYRKRKDLEREINPFEEEYNVRMGEDFGKLDLEYDALAVWIEATAAASISLIAVRFEYHLGGREHRRLRRGEL